METIEINLKETTDYIKNQDLNLDGILYGRSHPTSEFVLLFHVNGNSPPTTEESSPTFEQDVKLWRQNKNVLNENLRKWNGNSDNKAWIGFVKINFDNKSLVPYKKLAESSVKISSSNKRIGLQILKALINIDTAFEFALGQQFGLYKTLEISKPLEDIVKPVMQRIVKRQQQLEDDVNELLWDMNIRKTEAKEKENKIIHRQLMSVLEERVKQLAGLDGYQDKSFSQLRYAFRNYINGVKDASWVLTDKHVDNIKDSLRKFFPDELKGKPNSDILKFIGQLADLSSRARCEAFEGVHPENMKETEIRELVQGSEYEKIFLGLVETKASFRGRSLLSFIE
jgi:hypothetical protein